MFGSQKFVYSSDLDIALQINNENMNQWSMHGIVLKFDSIMRCPWIVSDWSVVESDQK